MLSIYALYLALFSLVNLSVMAAPINPLANIQCHCITFFSLSDPAPCALSGSENLDWETAQSFASVHNLNIQFASQDTASKVFKVERPLPSNVLMGMHKADEKPPVGSKVVCGFGNEVKQTFMRGFGEQLEAMEAKKFDMYVSKVVAVLLLMIIMYAAGEFIYTRFIKKGGHIKLEGTEKHLQADDKPNMDSSSPAQEKVAPVELPSQTD